MFYCYIMVLWRLKLGKRCQAVKIHWIMQNRNQLRKQTMQNVWWWDHIPCLLLKNSLDANALVSPSDVGLDDTKIYLNPLLSFFKSFISISDRTIKSLNKLFQICKTHLEWFPREHRIWVRRVKFWFLRFFSC